MDNVTNVHFCNILVSLELLLTFLYDVYVISGSGLGLSAFEQGIGFWLPISLSVSLGSTWEHFILIITNDFSLLSSATESLLGFILNSYFSCFSANFSEANLYYADKRVIEVTVNTESTMWCVGFSPQALHIWLWQVIHYLLVLLKESKSIA